MYKSVFKELKRKCPPPDYSSIIDFDDLNNHGSKLVRKRDTLEVELNDTDSSFQRHFKPIKEWEVFELKDKPGLLFIRNPFTWLGQRYWICRCLQDFSEKPNRLNLDAHGELKAGEIWWESSQGKDSKSTALRKKLRWATMGYHHDWNTKVYSESSRDPFPSDLAAVSSYVAKAVDFAEPFDAQAAIVNYYHLDSTLSGHTDHSEEHATAPLFSFSFGQTAIFLLGGQIVEDMPTAMYIKSGDIVIMSGYSRLCYHGVPKILKSSLAPWEPAKFATTKTTETIVQDPADKSESDCVDVCSKDSATRTNSTNSCENLDNGSIEIERTPSPRSKKRKLEEAVKKVDCSSLDNLIDDKLWLPFKSYVELSRINMNVRQVLFAGQKTLKAGHSSDTGNDKL